LLIRQLIGSFASSAAVALLVQRIAREPNAVDWVMCYLEK